MKFPENPVYRDLREGESVGGWLHRLAGLNYCEASVFYRPLNVEVAELIKPTKDLINRIVANTFSPNWVGMGRVRDAVEAEINLFIDLARSSDPRRVIKFPNAPKFFCSTCYHEQFNKHEIPTHKIVWNSPTAVICKEHSHTLCEFGTTSKRGIYPKLFSGLRDENMHFRTRGKPRIRNTTHYQSHLTTEALRIANLIDNYGKKTTREKDKLLGIYFLMCFQRNGPGPAHYCGEFYNDKYFGLKPFPKLSRPDSLWISGLSIPERCLCFDNLAKGFGPTPEGYSDKNCYFSGCYTATNLSEAEFGKLVRDDSLVAFSIWMLSYWNSAERKLLKEFFPQFWPIWEKANKRAAAIMKT